MLFDLRAGGRRRVVQVVYASLALLMGGGLVLFGVGGSVSGGLFDAFREGGSRSQAGEQFKDRLAEQDKKLVANPADAAALAAVAKLHSQLAGADENFNEDESKYTAKGLRELALASTYWKRYLATKPKKVEAGLAVIMANQVYGPSGLKLPREAIAAWEERLSAGDETAGLLAQYAQLAYLGSQVRKGDLAAEKAVELAPKSQRKELKEQLAALKVQIMQEGAQAAGANAEPAETSLTP